MNFYKIAAQLVAFALVAVALPTLGASEQTKSLDALCAEAAARNGQTRITTQQPLPVNDGAVHANPPLLQPSNPNSSVSNNSPRIIR